MSIYDFKELKFLLKKYKFDVIQCPFNILDKRIIFENWVNVLKKKKLKFTQDQFFYKV